MKQVTKVAGRVVAVEAGTQEVDAMCVGIPMKVVESDGFMAWCEGRGRREQLNMMLVGPQDVGTWVLAFVGSAREVLTQEQAAQIDDALDAVEAVMNGATDISAHFADLQDGTHNR